MLWAAPPPTRECQGYGRRLRLPRFGGAIYAVDFDNRSRYRQVGLSSAWRGCGRPSGPAPAIETPARLGIFPKTVAVPGGYRGVRLIALLVPRAAGVRACGAIDAAGLCEALRQAAEERHHGRRGHLRSGHKAEHAVRADQDGRAQSCLMLHRARHLFIRQQTAVINSIRAYLAEFGIVAPVG